MRRSFIHCLAVFLFLQGGINCVLLAQSSYKEIEVQGGGTIRGCVRLRGNYSATASFDVTKDPKYCGKKKTYPRLTIGKNKGVKNAIVCLEGITQGKKFSADTYTAVLNQSKCEYGPHITILHKNTNLKIVNNDPILHNVHAYSLATASRSMFNIAQPIRGQCTTIKQKQLGNSGLILTTCDAGHPWMSAYIMVTEHPYVVVTDENGKFEMDDIPTGTYKLSMWHEGVAITSTETEAGKVKKYCYEDPYEETKEVTVPANSTVDIDFDMTLRESSPTPLTEKK
jgi:hypothetical protein